MVEPYKTMIVSAYYKIPSKQSHSNYIPYLQRWFRSLSAPAIFFTTPDMYEEILSWGYSLTQIQFVMLPITEFTAFQKYGYSFWEEQCRIDVEKYHTPELAGIWYEKKEFVRRAMNIYCEETIFIWCDAGCIRDQESENAFCQFGMREATLNDNTIHLQYINSIIKSFYCYPDRSIAGAIIAGNRNAWIAHCELYDTVIEEYLSANICLNMDQYIIKSCADRKPDLYTLHTIPAMNRIDEWFFFLGVL